MGDGKRLKEIIDAKGTNVRTVARAAGISPTTIYSIIQKDSNIRFDYAIRLANVLDISEKEICSAPAFSGELSDEEIYPTLPDGLHGILNNNRIDTYMKHSLRPLMQLYGATAMPDVDNLLTMFYRLNDETRKEVIEITRTLSKNGNDPERVKDTKNIKGW